jgi:hypothetical protein
MNEFYSSVLNLNIDMDVPKMSSYTCSMFSSYVSCYVGHLLHTYCTYLILSAFVFLHVWSCPTTINA